jgi:hypothetical protein
MCLGPEQLAGPVHGVPLKAANHLLNLVDQGVRSVLRTFINVQYRDAPHKIVQWSPA